MCFGHAIFLFLHLIAITFSTFALLLTVPLHMIFAAIAQRGGDGLAPSPRTHVRCPDCRELVLRDANVCKHCGCKLTPMAPLKWWQADDA